MYLLAALKCRNSKEKERPPEMELTGLQVFQSSFNFGKCLHHANYLSSSLLFYSVFALGYFKTSVYQLMRDLYVYVYCYPIVALGKTAIDVVVHKLDGTEEHLLNSYGHNLPPGMPLILVFGSYS
jgi:hypothetical protein